MGPPFDQFLTAAEAVARPEVDPELVREVLLDQRGDLHDPEAVSAAYLIAASTLQL